MRYLRAMIVVTVFVAGLGCGSPAPSSVDKKAEPPKSGFTNIVMTADEETKAPRATFAVDTPVIFVFADLENVSNGTKAKAVWVCEKSEVTEPNYTIDEATVTVGLIENKVDFSLSKPTNGWPVGDYRVDLYLGDKVIESLKFKVSK